MRETTKHRSRMTGALLITSLAMMAGSVSAALVSTGQAVKFNSGQESIWGAGQGVNFRKSGSFGGSTAKVGYNVRASSGTATVAYNGSLGYTYDDTVTLGQAATLDLGFLGGASRLVSAFGAGFDTTYNLNALGININGCIFCKSYDTDINEAFTAKLGGEASGRDAFELARVEFGPNVIVGSATVGSTADVSHASKFKASAITGTLEALNRGTGTSKLLNFSLADAGLSLDLGLDELGLWDITLKGLNLVNNLNSAFGIDLNLFAGAHLGFDCGDPWSNDDNGFFCGGDVGVFKNVGAVSLGSVNKMLGFNTLNLNPFSINVQAAKVPEPGILSLFGLGLVALGFMRRRSST